MKKKLKHIIKESGVNKKELKRKEKRIKLIRNEIKNLIRKTEEIQEEIMKKYEQYREGIIDKNDYLSCRREEDKKTLELKNNIDEKKQRIKALEKKNASIEISDEDMEIRNMDDLLVELLIDRITVFKDNRIEIAWNFK